MQQHYDQYTTDDHKVWRILFERQTDNLADKACEPYLTCLRQMHPAMWAESIPRFSDLDNLLLATTGWQIEVVPGHIPVEDFFDLLSHRRFPASTWLRKMDQLDYLEEPDMFHDIYGHVPLLMDLEYAHFMHQFGKLGVRWKNNPAATSALRSLYWFTIEFGLLALPEGRRIYGAGILSSFGESRQVFERNCQVTPFDLQKILSTPFRTDVMQNLYFACDSMDSFQHSLTEADVSLRQAHAVRMHTRK